MMTKTLILFLTLGIAAAGVVEVDNMMAIGRFLKAENLTTAEDFELEQAASGLGAIVLAETSGRACNQGSGRAQTRCNELARRVFGNSFVSSGTVTMYHNLVNQCSWTTSTMISTAINLAKSLMGQALTFVKAVFHCKVCKSSSACHSKVKEVIKFGGCLNRVTHTFAKAFVSGEKATGSMSKLASWASSLLYTCIFKILPECAEDDIIAFINGSGKKYANGVISSKWDVIRFVSSVLVSAITGKISSHVANLVAAFAVPGFGTAWSAAKFGWSLYGLARDCKWDVQAAIKSLISAGVSLYQAATGRTNTACASKLSSALTDVLDVALCWLTARHYIYRKMGCSSSMIRRFA